MSRHTTLLAILQQSEYELADFRRWYDDHHQETLEIKPDQWTSKLQLISTVSKLLFFLPELQRYTLATMLVLPLDKIIRWSWYTFASIKLAWFRWHGLTVVAIAGSYAKTSTKNIISHLLGDQLEVLVTPKSINTVIGVSQVIGSQLQGKHQLFVVEFGEFNSRDVALLTAFTKPDYAILTPIGRQHLERFGSLEAITQTFLPLVHFFTKKKNALLLAEANQALLSNTTFDWYGEKKDAQVRVKNVSLSRSGTEFSVQVKNQTHRVFMPLFGAHQALNTLPSFWLGHKLHLNLATVVQRAASLPYLERRHEPHFAENNVLILDNSYNTNPDSVKASLKLIKGLPATRRIILTPGFVELGEQTMPIHHAFGQLLAANVDYAGFIKAPWTSAIIDGFVEAGGKRDHLVVDDDFDAVLAKLSGMIVPDSVVLFEGGFREIYV